MNSPFPVISPIEEWRRKLFNNPCSSSDCLGSVAMHSLEVLAAISHLEHQPERVQRALDNLESIRSTAIKYDSQRNDFLRQVIYGLSHSIYHAVSTMPEMCRSKDIQHLSRNIKQEEADERPFIFDVVTQSKSYSIDVPSCSGVLEQMVVKDEIACPSTSFVEDRSHECEVMEGTDVSWESPIGIRLHPRAASSRVNQSLMQPGTPHSDTDMGAPMEESRTTKLISTVGITNEGVEGDAALLLASYIDSISHDQMRAAIDGGASSTSSIGVGVFPQPATIGHSLATPQMHQSWKGQAKRSRKAQLHDIDDGKRKPKSGKKEVDTSVGFIDCPLCEKATLMRPMGFQTHLRRAHSKMTLTSMKKTLVCECGMAFQSFCPVFYHMKKCERNIWRLMDLSQRNEVQEGEEYEEEETKISDPLEIFLANSEVRSERMPNGTISSLNGFVERNREASQ